MPDITAGAFHRREIESNDEERLTIDNTVGGIALTAATYGTSRRAIVTVEDADLRYTTSGAVPTSAFGTLAHEGDKITLESNEEIVAFRAIRATATDSAIHAVYMDMKLS